MGIYRYKCGNGECGEEFDEYDRSTEEYEICPVCGTTNTRPAGRAV